MDGEEDVLSLFFFYRYENWCAYGGERDAASLENFHFRVPSIGRMVAAARRDQ